MLPSRASRGKRSSSALLLRSAAARKLSGGARCNRSSHRQLGLVFDSKPFPLSKGFDPLVNAREEP